MVRLGAVSTVVLVLGTVLAGCGDADTSAATTAAGPTAATTAPTTSPTASVTTSPTPVSAGTPPAPATTAGATSTATTAAPTTTTEAIRVVLPGAAVLARDDFSLVAGKRVGLIANQTSRVGDRRFIDVIADHPAVTLAAVFAPEHGVTGTAGAGEVIGDATDPAASVPIFSLYGTTRKPTPEMLAGLDVLLFDLQDVGSRFYTYISTMGLAMQASAEAGIPFLVLDRPNPISGQLVEGFVRETDQESFIGQYPIPIAYGMTAGELALAIHGEGWLTGVSELDLTVVPMEGWRRADRWTQTGLEWVPPSPGLPSFASAIAYPGTVLFEATSISYGQGTREPFAVIGAPWGDAAALVADLAARDLPGVTFEPVAFTPRSIDLAPEPRMEGIPQQGVRIRVTDQKTFQPVATGFHVLDAFRRQAAAFGVGEIIDRAATFDLLAGTTAARRLITAGVPPEQIVAAWQASVAGFLDVRERYLIYG